MLDTRWGEKQKNLQNIGISDWRRCLLVLNLCLTKLHDWLYFKISQNFKINHS